MIVGEIGVKSSGGNSLVVDGIFESDHDITIYVLDATSCAATTMTALAAITVIDYPMTAFLIRKTEKPLSFYVRQAKIGCAE